MAEHDEVGEQIKLAFQPRLTFERFWAMVLSFHFGVLTFFKACIQSSSKRFFLGCVIPTVAAVWRVQATLKNLSRTLKLV